MVCSDGIDLFNLVAERHRLVDQKLNEVMRGGFSGQQLKFSVDSVDPSATDAAADLGVGKGESEKKIGHDNTWNVCTMMAPIGSKT